MVTTLCKKVAGPIARLAILYLHMNFTDKDLHQFETLLLNQKTARLKAEKTGEHAEEVVELDQTRMGRLSRMDAMQAQAMSLETGRRRRRSLANIDAALTRITEGDFGECFECGCVIDPRRLAAYPTATLCIHCAETLE